MFYDGLDYVFKNLKKIKVKPKPIEIIAEDDLPLKFTKVLGNYAKSKESLKKTTAVGDRENSTGNIHD